MRYGTDYIKLKQKAFKIVEEVRKQELRKLIECEITIDGIGSIRESGSICMACTALKMLLIEDKRFNYTYMYLMTSVKNVKEIIKIILSYGVALAHAKDMVITGNTRAYGGLFNYIRTYLSDKVKEIGDEKGYILNTYGEHNIIVVCRIDAKMGSDARKVYKLVKLKVENGTANYIFRDIYGYYVYAIETPDNMKKIRESGLEIVE